LRALHTVYGPLTAIHIDAHIDTWAPAVFAGANGAGSKQAEYADGTPYYWAGMEGLLAKTGNVHAGIRSSLDSERDLEVDREVGGFTTVIPAADILRKDGVWGVIERIRAGVAADSLHGKPIYVSLDVDVLDAAFAPGTAGPAAGGWTSREIIQIIIDGLEGLNIVGVDVVEVLPGMDTAEVTGIAAAEFTIEVSIHPYALRAVP
jgi:agmatinase